MEYLKKIKDEIMEITYWGFVTKDGAVMAFDSYEKAVDQKKSFVDSGMECSNLLSNTNQAELIKVLGESLS